MNRLTFLTILVVPVLFIPQAFALEEHHLDKPSAAKVAPGKDSKAADKQAMPMGTMQDSMFQMHEQMHKIMQTSDPEEREKLKQEHLRLMRGMKGPGMMMGDGMAGGKTGPAGGPMEKRMQMMERRLDAMQKTMEQAQRR